MAAGAVSLPSARCLAPDLSEPREAERGEQFRAWVVVAARWRAGGPLGDALDRGTMENALQDVEVVIQTLGVNFSPRVILEGTTLFSRSTRFLVDAMNVVGVKRLIIVTGLGAGNSRGHGGFLYDTVLFPLLLKRAYDDKDVQEQIVKSSGLDWTIARPGLLTDSPATGRYRVLTASKDWRAGTISRADVADFLVRQIKDRALIGTTPLLIS